MSLILFVMNNLDWWIATWIYMSINYFMNNLDWWIIICMLMLNYYDAIWCGHIWWIWYDLWIDIWIYTLMVYYMNNLLMSYYMKICIYVDDYYMNNLLMEYYMKVCIYVYDYYMNNLLMNYYMNAYAELTWWFYDVAIKWWTITWMFIRWWISMRL